MIRRSAFDSALGFYKHNSGIVVLFLSEQEGYVVETTDPDRKPVGHHSTSFIPCTRSDKWTKIEPTSEIMSVLDIQEVPTFPFRQGLYNMELIPERKSPRLLDVAETDDTKTKAFSIFRILTGKDYDGEISYRLERLTGMLVWRPFKNSKAGIVVEGDAMPVGLVSCNLG